MALRLSLLKFPIPSFCHIAICMKLKLLNGGTTHFHIETRWRVWSSELFLHLACSMHNSTNPVILVHEWVAITRLWPTISAAMVCCLLLEIANLKLDVMSSGPASGDHSSPRSTLQLPARPLFCTEHFLSLSRISNLPRCLQPHSQPTIQPNS